MSVIRRLAISTTARLQSDENCSPSNYSYVTFVVTMRVAMTTQLLNYQFEIDNMMNCLILVYFMHFKRIPQIGYMNKDKKTK